MQATELPTARQPAATPVAAGACVDGVRYVLYAGAFYRPILQAGHTVYRVDRP